LGRKKKKKELGESSADWGTKGETRLGRGGGAENTRGDPWGEPERRRIRFRERGKGMQRYMEAMTKGRTRDSVRRDNLLGRRVFWRETYSDV